MRSRLVSFTKINFHDDKKFLGQINNNKKLTMLAMRGL